MSIGAGLGLAAYTFSSSDGFWRWVRYCDEAGVDSLWQTDRMVSRQPFLECMSLMAALAGATSRIMFGMNVASLGIRDPLLIAKQCATIDYLSAGRLLPAFGLGSNRNRDWAASGRTTKRRGKRMDEALAIVTRLWAGEQVSFEGEFFRYQDVTISPRPVQSPLPLWIGGSARAAIERTGRFGTGWQAASESPEQVRTIVADIHAAAAGHGRRLDHDHFGIGFAVRFGTWDEPMVASAARGYERVTGKDPRDGLTIGGAAEILARIERYVDAGLSKFILRPIGDGDEDMLDQTRRIVAEVLPEIEQMNARLSAAE